jgi:hypothetical protein
MTQMRIINWLAINYDDGPDVALKNIYLHLLVYVHSVILEQSNNPLEKFSIGSTFLRK